MNSNPQNQASTPSLAIIDGTHLILLPNLDNSSPLAKVQSSTCNLAVPAVPLHEVCKLIGSNYISYYDAEGSDVLQDSENDDAGDVIETMHLHPSDFTDDMAITHPTKLMRDGTSSSSIRVWTEEADEALMCWSEDSECLNVHLPIWSYSYSQIDDDENDDIHIYGDQCDGLLNDYNTPSRCDGPKRKHLQIKNAGSCLIADFLGMGGYQQLLMLPQLDCDYMGIIRWDGPDSDEAFKQTSTVMKNILAGSLLTDGQGILHSKRSRQLDLERHDDGSVAIELPVLELDGNGSESVKSLKPAHTTASKRDGATLSADDDEFGSYMNVGTDTTTPNTGKSPDDSQWLKTLEQTINHRISMKLDEAVQIEKSNHMCQQLITRGRNTLHKAIRCRFDNDKNLYAKGVDDPQVVRLRYGMQPRSSTQANGISVVMDLEVDLYLPKVQHASTPSAPKPERNATSETGEESSYNSSVLHDFHISCSMTDVDPSPSRNQFAVSCEQIRTVSGLVPTFQPGECVTILASVYFTNLEMSVLSTHAAKASTVELTIQGYWVDEVSLAQRTYWSPADRQNRQGEIMCILQLQQDVFFLSTPSASSSHGGRCIHHEIDFEANSANQEKYTPTAIFEHREPRTLMVDISSDASTFHDPKIWKDLVSSLNTLIGLNSHIDLYWKQGDPRLKVVIFGSNADERAATVKLVLRHLPDSAKLTHFDDPNESQHAKALLLALQNEADAIKRHYALEPNKLSLDAHTELAALQCATDGIASLIKRGWSSASHDSLASKSSHR